VPKRSRSGSADDEGPTYLAKPFAEVAGVLDVQIAKGRDLFAQFDVMVFPQPGHLNDLSAKYRSWHNYNATYLERAFTTKELHDDFEGGVAFAIVSGRETALDRLRDLANDLQRDINHLAALRDRLTLYEPPEPPPYTVAPAPTPTKHPLPPIHVTFQGQVGQVNLADVIKHADARIEQVDQRGEAGMAEGLKQLADAIKAASEAAEDQREDALDAVAVLAEVGVQPVEERGKLRGRVRGAIAVIKDLAEVAPTVKKALDAWGPTIMEHLPHLPS
jgi:hypothetical protein